MSLNHKTNFFPTPPMCVCVCVCVCSDSLFFSFLLRFCLFALFLSRRCLYKNIYSMSSFGCDAMWCSNARQPAFAWATGSGLDEEAGNIHLGDSMPVEWSNGPGLCVPLWMWICMSGLQLDWSKASNFYICFYIQFRSSKHPQSPEKKDSRLHISVASHIPTYSYTNTHTHNRPDGFAYLVGIFSDYLIQNPH